MPPRPARPPLGLFDNPATVFSLDELAGTVRKLERERPGRTVDELTRAVFAELAMKRTRRATTGFEIGSDGTIPGQSPYTTRHTPTAPTEPRPAPKRGNATARSPPESDTRRRYLSSYIIAIILRARRGSAGVPMCGEPHTITWMKWRHK